MNETRAPSHWGMAASRGKILMGRKVLRGLVLCASAVPISSFKVLIDLNLFSKAELANVGKLPRGLDGVWEISVNSHNTSDADWRAAIQTVSPGGFAVTEDNPMETAECRRYANITGKPPSLAFSKANR